MKVLIIEDNEGDYIIIEELLVQCAADTKSDRAKSYAEAVQTLTSHNNTYDLILLDLTLPDASGETLVHNIVNFAKDIPVIVLTGYSDNTFGIKTLSMGVSDYLLKDELNISQLNKAISYSIERKKISLQLKESEEKYRNLFHLSPIPMWVFDIKTLEFLNVNSAAIKHYGYSREEFYSMTIKDIRPQEEIPHLEKVLSEIKGRSSYQGTFKHKKKNGEIIYVDAQTNSIIFNNRNAEIVLATDITESIKHINEIEEQNKKLKEIAWIQSHIVRAPIARILGLAELKLSNINSEMNYETTLGQIKDSATELDNVVREIITKTEKVETLS
jgi:PAS domain S-box-containing protein